MIRLYHACGSAAEASDATTPGWALADDVVWIDLVDPGRDEDAALEKALGLSIPTREEMAEIEASSRLYRENGATYLTADLLFHGDEDLPGSAPVTFILTSGPVVTIRYSDPRPFAMLAERMAREPALCGQGWTVFLNLMEAVIDRTSEILTLNGAAVEAIGDKVFGGGRAIGFESLLTRLGRAQTANARIQHSLSDLARIFAYVALDDRIEASPDARDHLRSLGADAQSLIAHAQSVSANISFQLNAALGLINIEQSSIIKIFSVAAVAFLPPTLIASIYGMNFQHMPELSQPWAYPAALAAMVVSAVAPLAWFKKKGWL